MVSVRRPSARRTTAAFETAHRRQPRSNVMRIAATAFTLTVVVVAGVVACAPMSGLTCDRDDDCPGTVCADHVCVPANDDTPAAAAPVRMRTMLPPDPSALPHSDDAPPPPPPPDPRTPAQLDVTLRGDPLA